MSKLQDFIFGCIERALSRRSHPRIGLVSSYDPKTHSAKFMRQPENIETGFLPLHGLAIGNDWGVLTGAQIGDQYVLGFVNGDIEVPYVSARIFSDLEKPPAVQSGEILTKHEKGSLSFFKQDGSVQHTANQGMTVTAGKAITLNAGQPMTLSGGGNLT